MEPRTCRPDITVGATAILDTYWSRTSVQWPIDRRRNIDPLDDVSTVDAAQQAGRRLLVGNTSIAHALSMRIATRNRKRTVDRRSRRKLTTVTDSNATHDCRAQAVYVCLTSDKRHAWLGPPPLLSTFGPPTARFSFVAIYAMAILSLRQAG